MCLVISPPAPPSAMDRIVLSVWGPVIWSDTVSIFINKVTFLEPLLPAASGWLLSHVSAFGAEARRDIHGAQS